VTIAVKTETRHDDEEASTGISVTESLDEL
jgi:hypothetical protein